MLKSIAKGVGWILLLCVRGTMLWLFLIPSIVPWLIGLATWPFLRPFGVSVPVSLFYYSRWATYLLDALLTRVTPIKATPWPWHIDVRNSRINSWGDTFDWSLS